MNMRTGEIGVLMISSARHQVSFATVFSEHPRVVLRAVADEPDCKSWVHDANRRLAGDLDLPYIENLDDALARPDVDLVSVCPLYRRHAPIAIQALRAGKHVLLDKQPIAMSIEQGQELAEAARAAAEQGTKLTYLHHSLDVAVQQVRAQVDAGEIGTPRAVVATMIAFYGPGDDANTDALGQAGLAYHPKWWDGGELIHFGGYGISTARHIMQSEATSVFADTGFHFNRIHKEHEIEDIATLSVGYANGGVGTITVGRAPNPAAVSKSDSALHVIGTHGIATADWREPAFLLSEASAGNSTRIQFGPSGNTPVIHRFIDDILADRAPIHGAHDGLHDLLVLLAARMSASKGQTIDIGSVGAGHLDTMPAGTTVR